MDHLIQPWILVGGSYSGAQAGWVAATLPGTFWAYHASSAPVEAIWDYVNYILFSSCSVKDIHIN